MGGRGPWLQRGQSTVELALSSVVLLLLLLGLLDFARAFYFCVRLQDAVRAGARVGVVYDPQSAAYPGLNTTSISDAVNAVLSSAGLPKADLMNPGTTCPPTTNGNSLYNPPYQESDFPAAPGDHPRLYVCFEGTPGQNGPSAAPQQKDLEVVVLYKYSLITGFMQGQLGPGIDETAYYHGRIP